MLFKSFILFHPEFHFIRFLFHNVIKVLISRKKNRTWKKFLFPERVVGNKTELLGSWKTKKGLSNKNIEKEYQEIGFKNIE